MASRGLRAAIPGRLFSSRRGQLPVRKASTAESVGNMVVVQKPALRDNYAFLMHDPATGATAAIDTPEVGPIDEAVKEQGWNLTHILNTHHHWDHTGGNEELKRKYGCEIVGPEKDKGRVPKMDKGVKEGDTVEVGQLRAVVYETPGHTSGHICFHFPEDRVAFVGDTLFAMGCGRLFEGTPEQMLASLEKLKREVPDETRVYCAHEYTLNNAKFSLTVDPDNQALRVRKEEVERLRSQGKPTVPTDMAREKETNPFLRTDDPAIQNAVGKAGKNQMDTFTEVRRRKDSF